jgi:hypothetical protein
MQTARTWAALIGLGVMVTAWGGVLAQTVGGEMLAVDARLLLPDLKEHWDSAGGIELQWQLWEVDGLSFALAFGVQGWQGVEEYYRDRDSDSILEFVSGGEVTVLPFGASLHYRLPLQDGACLTLEAGLRYLYVDSTLTIDTYYTDAYSVTAITDTISVDDSIAAVFGARLEVPMDEVWSFYVGGGVQQDLGDPEEYVYGDYLDTTSFDAAYVSIGALMAF